MNDRRLITARELADTLGVSTGALLRWTRAGKVPAVKLPGGAIRFVPEQIDAWLDDRAIGGCDAGRDRPLSESQVLQLRLVEED